MRRTALVLFLLVVVIGIPISRGIGVTWDEPDNIFAGGVYVTFFKEGFNPHAFDGFWDQRSYFRNRMFTLYPDLSHYPPVPTYVGSAISLVAESLGQAKTSMQLIEYFHFATVLFFALLVAMVYRFARLLGFSWETSLFAALATFLFPTLFGHGLSNIKDTAQVAMFVTSLYYLVRGKKYDVVIGAVCWGLALATKFNAVYVPIIWVLATGINHIKQKLFVVLLGLLVAFIVWPYLWFDPIHRIGDVVGYFTSIGEGYRIFWYGKLYVVGGAQSLWWYPWVSFLIMTPLILLGLAMFGGLRGGKRALLLIWILTPLARTFLPHATFYDGLRHFMEVIPALVLLAASGLEQMSKKVRRVVMIVVIAHLLIINSVYFPFSTGYYNVLAPNPNDNLDRDIEALSVKEGLDWLHSAYTTAWVWVPIANHAGWPYAPGGKYLIVHDLSSADTVIVVNKLSHRSVSVDFTAPKGFTLVHTIARGNNIFGWIYRRVTAK